MVFVSQKADGERVEYRDSKRWLWILSVLSPSLPLLTVYLLYVTDYGAWASIPMLVYFGLVPLLDWLIGEDTANPPEEVIEALSSDPYYRVLLLLSVPVFWSSFIATMWAVAILDIPILAKIVLVVGAGVASGSGLTVGHELGHKLNAVDQFAAKLVNAVTGYAHFCIEHNRGHHRHVATPTDPASSRMGENIYKFALREIPGAFRRGWQVEKERLARLGKPVWHPENEVLQSYALSAVLQVALVAAFGWIMLPFLAIHNFFAWWQLTSANYIEHYGLLRKQNPNGSYEHCQPWHSWNADYIASNLLLYQLERHSDHHAHPTRRYQCLRSFPDLPTLPNGYFGMFLVALIPALWYRLMDRRLLALPHISGDFSRINVDPGKRAALEARYGDAVRHGALAA